MSSEDAALLRDLLERRRLLALGVLVDGEPYVGLLPFAVAAGYSALVVHASRLARHTRGLGEGARFSTLVHAPDEPDSDPLQIPRVSFQGEVRPLGEGTPEHEEARRRYLARFPDSAGTFELGDFGLYALRIREGRLVGGFARARNVSPEDLLEASRVEAAPRRAQPSGGRGPVMRSLSIVWQRLVSGGGKTCERCEATHQELQEAVATLREALRPLGIEPTLETREIDEDSFRAHPAESNRIWIAGRSMEEWLDARVGSSPCCSVCGDSECRTVEIDGSVFETIPRQLFLRAALMAASRLLDSPAQGAAGKGGR